MNAASARRGLFWIPLAATLWIVLDTRIGCSETNVFFDSSQTTNLVTSGVTSDTIRSEGYLFTVTRDKLFTGGVGLTNPVGRMLRVPWPHGLEAQAVTTGPAISGARIRIERQNGQVFDILSFTAQLLANTGGAGAAFEIMPLLNGEDGAPDPFMYDATGYAGMQFTYFTPELSGFDAYKMTLYVDFAVMTITLIDASPPRPLLDIVQVSPAGLRLSWPTNGSGYVLESCASLPSAAWSLVTNTIFATPDGYAVDVGTTASNRFFRLRK